MQGGLGHGCNIKVSAMQVHAGQLELRATHVQAAQVSQRILATDHPVIVQTKQLMAGKEALSLAQGVPPYVCACMHVHASDLTTLLGSLGHRGATCRPCISAL